MNKIKIAMAVIAMVMVFSTSAVAFAQTPEPPTPPTPPAYGQTFWQALADKLGIPVDKLQQAVRDALKTVVAQLLKDGKLTQQQADDANARIDKQSFDKPPFGPFPFGRGRGMNGGWLAFGKWDLDAAAQKLGMKTEDLMAELRNGKSLADVAKEKGVSADDLKAAIITTITTKIDQAVKDGKLTQAQADQIKSKLDEQINLDMRFQGRNKGWPKDQPFFGGRWRKAPQPTTP